MKKWSTLILALAILALIAAAGFLYNTLKDRAAPDRLMTAPSSEAAQEPETVEETTGETDEPTEEVDMTAPDFTVYDADGNAVTLESLRGKSVIVNFWATWCGYCVMEMPEFQEAFDAYGDQIHFMMINVTDGYQETKEEAAAFITEHGFTFPVYYDLDLSATNAYGVNAMPVTYFIDENGDLVAWGQGALDLTAIRQGIDMLLGE